MNEKTLALLKQAKAEKRLFFYSWPIPKGEDHRELQICLDCDVIFVSDKYRDQIDG